MRTKTLDLDKLVLLRGQHPPNDGLCLLEAVAYMAGEAHTDHPTCVSPVLGAFGRRWNDDLDDAGRQRLKAYIQRFIGTAGDPAADQVRAWMCTDWMVRVHTPAWLELGGMPEQAAALRALPPLASSATAIAAQETISAAGAKAAEKATAARAAAWDAARDAAWAAAWDAAWDGARAAARDKKYDAARLAARGVLEPTKLSLQESAFDLLDRMLAVGQSETAAR